MKQVLGLTIFIHGDYLFDLITQKKKKTEKHIIKCVCVCVCVYSSPGIFILRHVQERGKKESVKEHRVRKGQA
jgi:hypothetical protein